MKTVAKLFRAGGLLVALATNAQVKTIDSLVTHTVAQFHNQINHYVLPAMNVDSLIQEDSLRELSPVPYPLRFGIPLSLNINLLRDGTVFSINNMGKIYAIRITANNAKELKPEFDSFYIPPGGLLYVLNDNFEIFGNPLSFADNQPHNYNVLPIPYTSFYLAYFEPDTLTDGALLKMYRVIFVYKKPLEGSHYLQIGGYLREHAKSCNEKVFCADWLPEHFAADHIRAVFGFEVSGWLCTGVSVNQAVSEREIQPYFLTARHCLVLAEDILNPFAQPVDLSGMTFYFNFSSPDCLDNIPYDLVNRYRHPIVGASLVAMDYPNDFALLKMNAPPPPHYKVYYAGWTASVLQNVTNALFIGVHHPRGDIKMASKTFGLTTSTVLQRYVVFWVNGITEGGSSGSSLFNHNGRVIGVLSGGVSGCVVPGPDNYGKFRNFWFLHKKVRDALNPHNKLILGTSGNEINCYENLHVEGNLWPAKDYQPNNLITLNAERKITIGGGGKPTHIKQGSAYLFQAGETIEILPGTIVEGDVAFEIIPCSSSGKKSDVEYEYIEDSVDEPPPLVEDSRVVRDIANSTFFSIYPNPSTNRLNFDFYVPMQDHYVLKIFNSMGQLVYSAFDKHLFPTGLQTTQIDIDKLGTGMYFLTLQNSAGISSYKFIVTDR